MKKKNNKGFMLTETLIVATLLITILLFMYVQFKNVMRSYDQSFKYNTINDLYALNNIKKYIEKENYVIMANGLNNKNLVELQNCPSSYFSNQSYCNELMKSLKIEKLYLTKQNVQSLKERKKIEKEMSTFINSIDFTQEEGYRLLAKFKDNTYGTLKILSGNKYQSIISNSCNAHKKLKYEIHHVLGNTNEDIFNPTVEEAGCGSIIDVHKYVKTDNICFINEGVSTDELNITEDETTNKANVIYKKIQSTLTVNYYQKSTTTKVADTIMVSKDCGDKINLNDYKKNITNRQYINSSIDNITMSNYNITVNMYYSLEGENIYD